MKRKLMTRLNRKAAVTIVVLFGAAAFVSLPASEERFLYGTISASIDTNGLDMKPATGAATQSATAQKLAERISDKRVEVLIPAIQEAAKLIVTQDASADMAVFQPLFEPLFAHANYGGIGHEAWSAAAGALVRIGQPAVTMLVEKLKSKNEHDRWSAMNILSRIGEPKALVLASARALLRDSDDYVRRTAIESLERLGPVAMPAVAELQEQAAIEKDLLARQNRKEEYESQRVFIELALIRIRGVSPELVKAIASHLSSPGLGAAAHAASVLGELGNDARIALPELEQALTHPDGTTRGAVASAIRRIKSSPIGTSLEKAVEKPSREKQ
jgi:HEAT repeat protein